MQQATLFSLNFYTFLLLSLRSMELHFNCVQCQMMRNIHKKKITNQSLIQTNFNWLIIILKLGKLNNGNIVSESCSVDPSDNTSSVVYFFFWDENAMSANDKTFPQLKMSDSDSLDWIIVGFLFCFAWEPIISHKLKLYYFVV